MPKLSDHQSNSYTKILCIGDSKSGKTGSLVSLIKAGYKLRILDLDNLLDILKGIIMQQCPDKIDNVEFVTLRDEYKSGANGLVVGNKPKAFIEACKLLDHWKYDDVDLGKPAEWGPDCILVIDSLSRLCDAAYDFKYALAMGTGKFDGRAVYGDAQDAVESILAGLTSKSFATNIIVIAHLVYLDVEGSMKGYPQGVGQKLSPKIPQYFPSVVRYQNKAGKRTIQTNSTPLIDLANPKPFEVQPEYSIDTGLAEIFEVLRGAPKIDKPKSLTLKKVGA
jgi:hypothetical protein